MKFSHFTHICIVVSLSLGIFFVFVKIYVIPFCKKNKIYKGNEKFFSSCYCEKYIYDRKNHTEKHNLSTNFYLTKRAFFFWINFNLKKAKKLTRNFEYIINWNFSLFFNVYYNHPHHLGTTYTNNSIKPKLKKKIS